MVGKKIEQNQNTKQSYLVFMFLFLVQFTLGDTTKRCVTLTDIDTGGGIYILGILIAMDSTTLLLALKFETRLHC